MKNILNEELLREIELMSLFNYRSQIEGLKVHCTKADPAYIQAADRLFRRGLITQMDGGYLTEEGKKAGEHLDALLGILRRKKTAF